MGFVHDHNTGCVSDWNQVTSESIPHVYICQFGITAVLDKEGFKVLFALFKRRFITTLDIHAKNLQQQLT